MNVRRDTCVSQFLSLYLMWGEKERKKEKKGRKGKKGVKGRKGKKGVKGRKGKSLRMSRIV